MVAPVGGVRVGKAPLGPLVVTRSPTHLGDSPVPPVRVYTAAPVSHPAQRCSRSSPTPRNSNRSSGAHAATPDGSAQRSSLSASRGQTRLLTDLHHSKTARIRVAGGRSRRRHPRCPGFGPGAPPRSAPATQASFPIMGYDESRWSSVRTLRIVVGNGQAGPGDRRSQDRGYWPRGRHAVGNDGGVGAPRRTS